MVYHKQKLDFLDKKCIISEVSIKAHPCFLKKEAIDQKEVQE